MKRRKTKKIYVGDVAIGGDAPISVQSMTNTDTRDIESTARQIHELEKAGCEIIRVAVPDEEAAEALKSIKEQISIPLVADIHFSHRLALMAVEAGVDGLRINPGNIKLKHKVREIVEAAKDKGIPIRIGVNAGSLDQRLVKSFGGVNARAMVESALGHIEILESLNFFDIEVSVKASNILLMLEAYRMLAKEVDYPFHIGVTEAGTLEYGTVKSAVGIGILLSEGLGDTIRVSLTAHPKHEVRVGYQILKSLGLRQRGVEIISCPTCGRTEIDIISLAASVERKLENLDKSIKVAVMGCVVNGPGEAREADIGIAGGKRYGLIFRKGKVIKKVKEHLLLEELVKEIEKI
ncbi:flavodoxin-dependent (E)-4-hydroxy-3-methylbut-2-enyl-diphosphate synthase [Peptococcaceae bacterium]|nr:flavodoxin-dependent (E)-4-hydroxy-3-methylbut-2-enyl-diphosphate synthase [Peptococcaceae bacterium]MCL0101223.1 flavodoxin-dependent (E)-4-hydroxy-3-methylbut-2-enyl-diphosphate synthase [Peptococcaceae bacterium]MCL0107449.1 flavodoxin-dependent (E)-4-hydroxy-3-methylbut-2-enyl-diphosphate synthase [Peptococcaceae bacterium]